MIGKRACFVLLAGCCSAYALEPGELIINEVFFNQKSGKFGRVEGVELLVIKDGANLNSLIVTDRDFWRHRGEDQCVLQDLGQGFLGSVRSGTLVVIYNGTGTDDLDAKDHVLRFYAKSSLFCNNAPTTNAFSLNNAGDNIHLLHSEKQIDFVKYRATDHPTQGAGNPGDLNWENGSSGYVDVGPYNQNMGIRFLGDKADLNDYLAAWETVSETSHEPGNLGKPNGGRNTAWIQSLRKQSSKAKADGGKATDSSVAK